METRGLGWYIEGRELSSNATLDLSSGGATALVRSRGLEVKVGFMSGEQLFAVVDIT